MKKILTFNNGDQGIGVVMGVGHLHIEDSISMGDLHGIGYMKMHADSWATAQNAWTGHLVDRAILRADPKRKGLGIGLPHGAWLTVKDTLFSGFANSVPFIIALSAVGVKEEWKCDLSAQGLSSHQKYHGFNLLATGVVILYMTWTEK